MESWESEQSMDTLSWLRQALDLLFFLKGHGALNQSNRSWPVSSQTTQEIRINSKNNRIFDHALMGLSERPDEWRPLLVVSELRDGQLELLEIEKVVGLVASELQLYDLLCDDEADCDDQLEKISGVTLDTTHIVFIILALVFILAAITTALIRRHLLKNRRSKGPCKIILTSTDFVFPQIPDARRVDEGLETMLGQWLQQLQEFGGPEVDKPDLLQGSLGSIRPNIQASNGNLARTFFSDPRARYNGDLVQLKQLPVQGAFELKSKAMDVLITIHGLRHENLNPLIGCLTEPNRPCLVSEYCSRGSLEDVLVQDEIKLDWSFRLSLLTDLVRGMRYLHSTPIRAHGNLTSRNCVIDARWVLKITDYGLPTFYEVQNVQLPQKTARELLWTAPELLRDESLRKHGSQPGDVYSFGIIMQEVVVRGEPFCMLALSPEDIIEKVKRPPPLIRPSVSKGAAPPEAINIMRQCWAENEDMRPDFNSVHDLFKKLNHGRKVNIVDTMFQMLEKYSNNLEELIRERTEQLDMEKKKTEQLLNRMLPSSVAEKLKIGLPVDPEAFDEVTIYFSDIVGFTTISAYSTPFQVVDLLNDLYTCFDATINAYNVYKVETIGDAYMVVGGCPVRIPDHASQIATMALDLLHQSGKFKVRHLPKTPLRLRIGLHTGPCCAGVVGLTMPRYCLFGDTVNTASRMESTGAPWRIHLSQETRDRLVEVGGYLIEYRGATEVKGKGRMPTYWLLGKQDFDKELPVPPDLGEDHGLEETLILETLRLQESDISTDSHHRPENEEDPGPMPTTTSTTTVAGPRGLGRRAASCATGGTSPSVPARLARSEHSSIDRPALAAAPPLVPPIAVEPSSSTAGLVRRVPVSVHQEPGAINVRGLQHYALGPSLSARSVLSVVAAVDLGESHPQSTGDASEVGTNAVAPGSRSTPDYASSSVTKSTSGENAFNLGTPVSAAEVAAKLLCASTSSINLSSGHNMYRSRPRRSGVIEEDDLSMPYNHYRCLSPNEHYGVGGRRTGGSFRQLRRQFSLDRADDAPHDATGSGSSRPSALSSSTASARPLLKQNSAGAASDLERIEEAPPTPATPVPNQQQQQQTLARAPQSLSVESLAQLMPPRP
ncbi:hypothetical protein QAD02_022104 [Eretmocerus hayati]|uniref:Uncharacterized protein n=1 Tax=Eretmocerus hayati TaxID=131215 RepID=A0ACC2PWY3_9HYME|nr:hypothetical protein QAD02_022104 [Eretmocerus hayati]